LLSQIRAIDVTSIYGYSIGLWKCCICCYRCCSCWFFSFIFVGFFFLFSSKFYSIFSSSWICMSYLPLDVTKPTINQSSILSFCSTWNTYNKMCFCPNYASYFIRNNKFICLPLIQCMSRSISGIYNLCYAIWLTFPLYWQRGNIIHRLFIDFPMKHAFTEQMLMLVWYYATIRRCYISQVRIY
jgi:hypothetical protein